MHLNLCAFTSLHATHLELTHSSCFFPVRPSQGPRRLWPLLALRALFSRLVRGPALLLLLLPWMWLLPCVLLQVATAMVPFCLLLCTLLDVAAEPGRVLARILRRSWLSRARLLPRSRLGLRQSRSLRLEVFSAPQARTSQNRIMELSETSVRRWDYN